MSASANTADNVSCYAQDYYAWAREQAIALRERQIELIDFDHLAEEVEDLAKREQRELRNRLMRVLVHLLKWRFQVSRRSRSGDASLVVQRTEIDGLLADSPTLRHGLQEMTERAYAPAWQIAGKEMRLERDEWTRLLPAECPWSVEQILDVEFYPQAPK